MRPLLGITRDDGKRKPQIIKFYDFTKGGTDVIDMKISKYSCKSLIHRWTMVHFFYLLDTIRCNALSLFAIKKGIPLSKVSSFKKGWELVLSLVKPFVTDRSLNGLHIHVQRKISIMLGNRELMPAVEHGNFERNGETRQRCRICIANVLGVGHKQGKDKLTKIKSRCQECGEPVCEKHSKLICDKHL